MTIIKPGNKEEATKDLTFKCEVCGCEFIATHKEYERLQSVNGMFVWCKCPTCNNIALSE